MAGGLVAAAYVVEKSHPVIVDNVQGHTALGREVYRALSVRTGIPLTTSLCGFTLTTQWLVVCPAGTGVGLTNAVEFTPRG